MVEDDGASSATKKTVLFTEVFEKYAPVYIAMGMTYDEYWNDDVLKARDYREAYKLKKRKENEHMWLQGLYIYKAMECIFPLFNSWAKMEPKPYLEYPIAMSEEEVKEQEADKQKKEFLKMQEYLETQMRKGEKEKED